MPQTVDIQRVISTSTSNVSVEDLSKKGFKQVKVLNQNVITRLISQAVDQVLEVRSKEINREERDRVIKEARSQFEQLAKDRLEQERSRLDDVQKLNDALFSELETLRSRLSQTIDLQAERDRAQMQLAAIEKDLEQLRATVAEQESQLAAARNECAARTLEVERLGAARKETEESLQAARGDLEARLERAEAAWKASVEEREGLSSRLTAEAGALRAKVSELEQKASVDERELAAARRALSDREARVRELEAELESLRSRTSALETERKTHLDDVARSRKQASEKDARIRTLEVELAGHETRLEEVEALRRAEKEKLAETEKGLAAAEAQLTARTEELARLSSQQANAASMTESLLAALNQRLEQAAKPSAEVSEIKLSLDGLSRKLSNMAMSQAGFASGGEKELRLDKLFSDSSEGTIESNISKVQIKENKAGDVKGALAKLRKLQGGGGQDGESQR